MTLILEEIDAKVAKMCSKREYTATAARILDGKRLQKAYRLIIGQKCYEITATTDDRDDPNDVNTRGSLALRVHWFDPYDCTMHVTDLASGAITQAFWEEMLAVIIWKEME